MTDFSTNTILRVQHGEQNPYFLMARSTAQDERLSWEARGVLAYLLSKPDNWQIVVKDLQQHCGRDKVKSILKELLTFGYLSVVRDEDGKQLHGESGHFAPNTYRVHETPFTEKPLTANPHLHNTENTEERKTQEKKELVPSGTDGNSPVEETTLDNHATRLEAVRKTLSIGEDSYPLAAKYLQFLTGCVPEKDSKHRDNGDWHAYQLQRGMDAAEITAFGLWLADEYEGEPLRKPAAVLDYAGRFRADSDHALYVQRAKLRLSAPAPEPTPEPEPAAVMPSANEVISEAQQADVLATLAALTEAKS